MQCSWMRTWWNVSIEELGFGQRGMLFHPNHLTLTAPFPGDSDL